MANVCFHCGKGTVFGRSHTHHRGVAGGRWKKRAQKTQRVFKPNLHKVTIKLNGSQKQVKVCAKCLKRVRKDLRDGKRPFLHVTHYFPKEDATEPERKTSLKQEQIEGQVSHPEPQVKDPAI